MTNRPHPGPRPSSEYLADAVGGFAHVVQDEAELGARIRERRQHRSVPRSHEENVAVLPFDEHLRQTEECILPVSLLTPKA